MLVDQTHGAGANRLQLLGTDNPSGPALNRAGFQQLLEARYADLEELVEVRARNAQELHAFQQRDALVLGLLQHALIELQERQFPVDIELRRLQVGVVHALERGRIDRVRQY